MSILNWFKSLFVKKQCYCKNNTMNNHITMKRRNQDIVMPIYVYNNLLKDGIGVSVCFTKNGKPSCVQLNKMVNGKQTYAGTLKKYIGVKSFKDGNVCNFHENNVVKE